MSKFGVLSTLFVNQSYTYIYIVLLFAYHVDSLQTGDILEVVAAQVADDAAAGIARRGVAARELGSANDVARMIAFRRLISDNCCRRRLLGSRSFLVKTSLCVIGAIGGFSFTYAYMYLTWNE